MAITEHARHQMYNRLEQVLGADEAATLMEHLPPVGWADVATKRDLDVFANELRLEMRAGIAEVRTEIAELRGEFGGLRGEFGDLRAEFSKQLRRTALASVAALSVLVSIVAVAGLF